MMIFSTKICSIVCGNFKKNMKSRNKYAKKKVILMNDLTKISLSTGKYNFMVLIMNKMFLFLLFNQLLHQIFKGQP